MSIEAADPFSKLYRVWAPRIFNHFRRLSWTREDAADLTAEVFTAALDHFPQLRDRERAGGWLWSIANNQAANRVRNEQRRQEREILASPTDGERSGVALSQDHRLGRAMRALDESDRRLLLWREYSDLTYREIADLTGQTVNGVRSALYRARVRLREEYLKRQEKLR